MAVDHLLPGEDTGLGEWMGLGGMEVVDRFGDLLALVVGDLVDHLALGEGEEEGGGEDRPGRWVGHPQVAADGRMVRRFSFGERCLGGVDLRLHVRIPDVSKPCSPRWFAGEHWLRPTKLNQLGKKVGRIVVYAFFSDIYRLLNHKKKLEVCLLVLLSSCIEHCGP